VLIEHFKELKHQGMKNIDELILKGTQIDCVLIIDGSGGSIGFVLTMAISSSAGAEVRPLATVVMELFTATILTMVVTTILYKYFDGKEFKSQI
jgi:cobalt-zinc-cadmium resistance protein CzcA